jgi:ComEC/Rec2-related protein
MRIAAAILCAALASGLAASEIRREIIDQPRLIRVGGAAQTRWERLFEVKPSWWARQLAYLAREAGDMAPTLFTARLVYTDDPWDRRGVSSRQWRVVDREIKKMVLREIRCSRDPVYAPYLTGLLLTETDGDLAQDLLLTLLMIRPAGIDELALRLADPRCAAPLPAAMKPGNAAARSAALDLLIDLRGPDDPAVRSPAEFALLLADPGERNHLLARLPRGAQAKAVSACIVALSAKLTAGKMTGEDVDSWVVALDRLAVVDDTVVAILVEASATGPRAVAAAAVATLTALPRWTPGKDLDRLLARASAADADPVIRHALLNLLVRSAPAAVRTATPAGDPWAILAGHRERLAAWEWERFVPDAAPTLPPARPWLPWIAFGLVVGALSDQLLATAFAWPFGASAAWWAIGLPVAVAALFLDRRQPFAARWTMLLAAGLLGSALAASSRLPPPGPGDGRLVAVGGDVVKVAWQSTWSAGLVLAVDEVAVPAGWRPPSTLFVIADTCPTLRTGDRIMARGLWRRGLRGEELAAVEVDLTRPREQGPRAAVWAAIGTLDRRQELAASLIVGQGTPPERADFRTAGLSHVLAVSGMHLALAAALGAWLLRALGVAWGWRLLAVVALAGGYAWLTGGSPATLRSLAMILAVTACAAAGREPHRLGPVALAALVLVVWSPATALDAGFQLSLAAVLGIVTLGMDLVRLRQRMLPLAAWPLDRSTWRAVLWSARSTIDGLLIGVGASLATLPLVAWWFHTVNPWGAIGTLLAAPSATLALWSGLPWLGGESLWPGGPWDGLRLVVEGSLELLARTAHWAAGWPGAAIAAPPPPIAVILLWPLLFLPCPTWRRLLARLAAVVLLIVLWWM